MPHRALFRPFIRVLLHAGMWLSVAAAGWAQPLAEKAERGPHWRVAMQLQQPRANGLLPQAEVKPWHVHDALLQREQDTARVVIEFRPRSATADLRDIGTVRLQLSSQGTFSLRPRRGGVQMAWKSNF